MLRDLQELSFWMVGINLTKSSVAHIYTFPKVYSAVIYVINLQKI